MRTEDPWYDALASGWGDHDAPPAAPHPADRYGKRGEPRDAHAAVYLTVQRSAAFQQVRRRYRRFVLPAGAAFLIWYLAYVVTATVAPDLMARPLVGVFNVAMAAGLAQFASTFLLTWAYVRHARLRRDKLALELRWETQDMARVRTAGNGHSAQASHDASASAASSAGAVASRGGSSRDSPRISARTDAPASRTAWESRP